MSELSQKRGIALNFALLRRLKVSAGIAREMVDRMEDSLELKRLPNLAEVAFYLDAHPQEFYSLAFFWKEPTEAELTWLNESLHDPDRTLLLEQQTFQLLWERRAVGSLPVASSLRIIVFPEGYNQAQVAEVLEVARETREVVPGISGVWVGQSIDSPTFKIAIRSDWKSLQAQRDFIASPQHERLVEVGMAAGSTIAPVTEVKIIIFNSTL